MNKYRIGTNVAVLVLLLILSLSPNAHAAQNCSNLLQDYINWAAQPDNQPGNHYWYFVGLTQTSNVNNRKFASYTEVRILDHESGKLVGIDHTV